MTQHPFRHIRSDRTRQVPVTLLLLVTSATSIVMCQGTSSSPFQSTRKSRHMPIDFRPQYTQLYQVEKLKAQILRGLNMTDVPLPPTKPPKPITSIHNRLPVPANLTVRADLPAAIVWSEPVDSKPEMTDQLMFRVSNQKNKSSVINRVGLHLRLRSKHHPKKRGRKTKSSPSKKKKKRKMSKSKLPDVKGGGFQGDDQSSGGSSGSASSGRKRSGAKSKRRRKQRKKPQVKVLVQAVNEKSGKFKRVVVQRFAISKKFNWIHLPIPASLVSRAAQSTNQTLVLRVRCKRCYKQKVSIDSTLPRRRRKRKKKNKGTSGTAASNSTTSGASATAATTASPNFMLNPHRPYLVIRTADAPLATKAPPVQRQRSARHVMTRSGPYPGSNGGGSLCPGTGPQPWLSSTSASESPACCAESLRVDFKDLGWDHWVVYPAGFTTVVCRGACNRNSRSSGSSISSDRSSKDNSFLQAQGAHQTEDPRLLSSNHHSAKTTSPNDDKRTWLIARLRRHEDEPEREEAKATSSIRWLASEANQNQDPRSSNRGTWGRPPSRVVKQPETSGCVPQDRTPLEVMYYADPNTLMRTIIPDLISRSCGCLPD